MSASTAITNPKIPAAGPALPLAPGLVSDITRSVGLGLEYWVTPGRFIERCTRMGDRFTLRLPGAGTVTALTNPDDIRVVFTADPSSVSFAKVLKRFIPHHVLFGEDNIVGYDGTKHVKARRVLSPPFHGEALKRYEAAMADITERAMATWRYGQEVEFRDLIAEIALNVVTEVVFGVTDPGRSARVRQATLAYLDAIRSRRFLVQTVWATARGGRWDGNYDYLMRLRGAIEDLVAEEVRERRADGDLDRPDVLALFLRNVDEDAAPMTDEQIQQNMVGLLLAGFETTGTSLAWLASEVTRNRDILARLEETARAGDDSYIDATITETLRLRSPAFATVRYLERSLTLDDGFVLEQGKMVMPFIAAVHLRADVYPEPLRFMPERFLNEAPKTYAWLPFGGGVRRCVGGAFSMFEMRVIMRTILRGARFRSVTSPPEGIGRSNVVFSPSLGGRVTLDRIA